ncbi:MAG TPA: hypothetical protein GX708_08520 [Gallicola sp.]|nr:hypothetical protein [Gallicola sp.]
MIPKEDLESLLKTIKQNLKNLKEGNIDNVIYSLEVMESHLENNLMDIENSKFYYKGGSINV